VPEQSAESHEHPAWPVHVPSVPIEVQVASVPEQSPALETFLAKSTWSLPLLSSFTHMSIEKLSLTSKSSAALSEIVT